MSVSQNGQIGGSQYCDKIVELGGTVWNTYHVEAGEESLVPAVNIDIHQCGIVDPSLDVEYGTCASFAGRVRRLCYCQLP